MKRSYIAIALVLLISLALYACASAPTSTSPTVAAGSAAATTKPAARPAAQKPRYGGILQLSYAQDVATWDDPTVGGSSSWASALANQGLMGGDWTKGSAGGYGTKQTDWANLGYDTLANKAGYLAESWTISVDKQKGEGTIVFKLRPGVHFALDPSNKASQQVGGRQMTADDVLAAIKNETTNSKSFVYRSNPELRNIDVSKTGPMEITIKTPVANLVTAISRLGGSNTRIYPKELAGKLADWRNHVGTGPFMLTDYVAGSSITLKRNPNYWMKDPIGPGKGNQLPYLDGVQYLIIADPSTRISAFRTGKIDQIDGLTWEDAKQLQQEFPQMSSAPGANFYPGGSATYMRTDLAPFNNLKVRQALTMATDFNTIKQTINGGRGHIITFPYDYYKDYADLYVGLKDPDLPASVKDLYTYSPEKAKQLLAQAGYPNGFSTSVLCLPTEASYYEALASMWQKIGVNLTIDVKDAPTQIKLVNSRSFDGFTSGPGKAPDGIYYAGNVFNGTPSASINMSFVNDPYVKQMLPKIRTLAGTDENAAMKQARDMAKYALAQAWAIPVPAYPSTTFWWPWLKNYSGEISVGYFNWNWSGWVWLDQAQKKAMGH